MISKLEDFNVYNLSMQLGEKIWSIVIRWEYFAKDTVGRQLVKAADSIAANLSEGLGRYHYREAKNFSYYSRGSLFETKTWIVKSVNRKLISKDESQELFTTLDVIGKMLNKYISSIGFVSEPSLPYGEGETTAQNNTNPDT